MGITGYTAAEGISFSELMNVERLLNSTGRSVYLEDESLLNGVTALSGSGPCLFLLYHRRHDKSRNRNGN